MLSAANLNALEDAGLSFIVGSRTSKAPKELEDQFGRRGNAIADDGVVELIRPMGQGRDRRDRRVVWHYKWERAKRDRRTLNAQIDRTQRVADRAEPLKKQRFVKITDQKVILDEVSIQRARESAGYKGTSPTSRRRSWTAMPSWRPITTSGKSSSPSVWPRLT